MLSRLTTGFALLLAATSTVAQTSTSCNPTEKCKSSDGRSRLILTIVSLSKRCSPVIEYLHPRLHNFWRRQRCLECHRRQRHLHLLRRRIHHHQVRRRTHHSVQVVSVLRPGIVLPQSRPRHRHRIIRHPRIRRPRRNRLGMARRQRLRLQSAIQLLRQRKHHLVQPRCMGCCKRHPVHNAQLHHLLDLGRNNMVYRRRSRAHFELRRCSRWEKLPPNANEHPHRHLGWWRSRQRPRHHRMGGWRNGLQCRALHHDP